MKPVNKSASVNITAKVDEKRAKSAEPSEATGPHKKPCLTRYVQDELTTTTLDVPGVEVVKEPTGSAFAGPFYPDQLELLRDTVRGMRKRERYVVYAAEHACWIHKKP